MQLTFTIVLLSFAAILFGLLFAALPYLRSPEPDRPAPLWVFSLAIYAVSLTIFAWLAYNVEDLSKPKFAISTLANLAFFVAAALQAAFFRSLNKAHRPITLRTWLPVSAILYALIFEWARHGTLDDRIIASSTMGLLPIAWQIYELRALKRDAASENLNYLLWVAILEACCGCARISLSLVNEHSITQFSTIPIGHALFSLLQVILTICSFIGVSKFWTERIAAARQAERAESEKVKLLIAEKDKLLLKLMANNKTSASGVLSATVIHEITQPLTALTLNLSAALRGLSADEQSELETRIRQCKHDADRISEIVQMIRALFASERYQSDEADLREVVNSVFHFAEAECKDSGIELLLQAEDNLYARASFKELQHILLNLVVNAIQHLQSLEQAAKSIEIRTWREANRAVLTVSDNGQGIPVESVEGLFTLLDTSKKGGMGIGLWLCKQIAERNSGVISYEPNTPHGSTFKISFALANA